MSLIFQNVQDCKKLSKEAFSVEYGTVDQNHRDWFE
jgi:hypothetical protein